MRNFIFVFAFLMATTGWASPNQRLARDIKLPNQKVIEKQTVTTPGVAATTNILNASVGPTSAAVTVVASGITNPDVPRNLVITPSATTADVAACVITVTGTDMFDAVITEAFSFLDNASTATTGVQAFKTVTSVSWAASCEDSPYTAKWSIGGGSKLGLRRCMDKASDFVQAGLAGVFEATRPTIVAHSTTISKNTAALNSSLNGTDVQLYYMQGYGCSP